MLWLCELRSHACIRDCAKYVPVWRGRESERMQNRRASRLTAAHRENRIMRAPREPTWPLRPAEQRCPQMREKAGGDDARGCDPRTQTASACAEARVGGAV